MDPLCTSSSTQPTSLPSSPTKSSKIEWIQASWEQLFLCYTVFYLDQEKSDNIESSCLIQTHKN